MMNGKLMKSALGIAVACTMLALAPSAWAAFGLQSFSISANNHDGSPATQAGSAPYALTAGIAFNATTNSHGEPMPDGNIRQLDIELPKGVTGNPGATQKCTAQQLSTAIDLFTGVECPDSSAVGVVTLQFADGDNLVLPVYNMVAPPGVPAQLGFNVLTQVPVVIDLSVRTGGGYGLVASAFDLSQAVPLVGSTLTVWGEPSDPAHDSERGHCLSGLGAGPTGGECPGGVPAGSFVNLPSSCGPLVSALRAESWQEPGVFLTGSFTTPTAIDGCGRLDFNPSVVVQAETTTAGSPTGLSVDVHSPQNPGPGGLAEASLKKTVVTLPAGMTVNPSSANGLGACTPEEIALENANPPSCPDSAKIGTVEVDTPILENPLQGSVYIAQQQNNPFGSLLALYLIAEGSGVLIKVPGEVRLDAVTGQITTVFDNIPQQPFSDIKLHLFGGSHAALATPTGCGSYTTNALLTPYSSETPDVQSASSFRIDSSCGGGFAPSFTAGTTGNQAGAFSPFVVTFSRSDQDQSLGGVTVTTPPGLLAVLKGVERCGEPQASQGACGAGSLIGHTTVAVGPGPDPFYVQGGQVFLTGPYKGAPFGLSIVVPAKAGPFDLGTVVVRAAINVDPHTARISIVSDPLPTILQGIPLDVRAVNVTVDRSGFTFNPTSCEPLSVGGTLSSTQGATAQVSSRFQAAGCQGLGFHPVFRVSTQARTSKARGASLDVKVTSAPGQANIGKTVVSLPKQLPARLTTIQQACPEATFAANPASCPVASAIGTGTASTPILANPVTGPAYLVSHGGAAFPDVVVILQGEGVTVDLVGAIDIKHGITTASFNDVPDVPISQFELNTPEGPHSGLAANLPVKARGSMCGQNLVMPTTITGQNGAQIKQNTKISVVGCPKVKKKKAHKPKRPRKKRK